MWADLAWCILAFQRVWRARGKDRKRACSWLYEVETLGTVPALSPPLLPHWRGQQLEAEAFVSHINEWQTRPSDVSCVRVFGGGCSWSGRDPQGGGVTGPVSQMGWQTSGLWERVSEAIRGLHGLTWGPFMGLSNCWPPTITPCKGNALPDEWRNHVSEDGARDKRRGGDEQRGIVGELGGLGCAFE